MIFQFKDENGYYLDSEDLPMCPFNQDRACLTDDCAAFEMVYDEMRGYCGLTQGATCARAWKKSEGRPVTR